MSLKSRGLSLCTGGLTVWLEVWVSAFSACLFGLVLPLEANVNRGLGFVL